MVFDLLIHLFATTEARRMPLHEISGMGAAAARRVGGYVLACEVQHNRSGFRAAAALSCCHV